MSTDVNNIFDLFSTLQDDWRLTTLFVTSGSDAYATYLTPWLMFSCDDFSPICDQSLIFSSGSTSFVTDLTQENQNILAQLMTKYWLQKEVQNILQMSNSIQDRDFKTYSQAQNLSAKKDLYNAKLEELDRLLGRYEQRRINWANWKNQNFDGTS
jgi:hypothetical protein